MDLHLGAAVLEIHESEGVSFVCWNQSMGSDLGKGGQQKFGSLGDFRFIGSGIAAKSHVHDLFLNSFEENL